MKENLKLTVYGEEKQELELFAKRQGLYFSVWARNVLLSVAREKPIEGPLMSPNEFNYRWNKATAELLEIVKKYKGVSNNEKS